MKFRFPPNSKKGYNWAPIVFFLFFVQALTSFSQVAGDYRTAVTGEWSTLATWQRYNGSTWATPTAGEGYPGQYAGTNNVTILSGHTVTITSTITTQPMKDFTINSSGRLFLTGATNSAVSYSLSFSGVNIRSGGSIYFQNKAQLKLSSDAVVKLVIQDANALVGTCNNNDEIWIGNQVYAVCTGATGDVYLFSALVASGGSIDAVPASNSPICQGNSLSFTGTYTGTVTSAPTYRWVITAPGGSTSTQTIQNVTINNATTGTYTATLTVSTINGSTTYSNSQTILATVNPLPTLTGATQSGTACSGSGALINLTGLVPSNTFDLYYTINNGSTQTATNLTSSSSGTSSFTTTSLTSANNGQTLRITGIKITNPTTACTQSFSQTATLSVWTYNGNTWIGAVSSDWNTAGNWCGGVPNAGTNVFIPAPSASVPNQPSITSADAICNNITINSGATLTMLNSHTLTVKGNWVNNGTFTRGDGTVSFINAVSQSISGTAQFNNLTINNMSGVTLSNDITVNGILNFQMGVVTTGENKVIIASGGSITRTFGHVYGSLQKVVGTGTSVNTTFEIGGSLVAAYAPVNLTFASVSASGNVTAATVGTDHPQIESSTLSKSQSINRYWTLTNSAVGFTTCDAVFNFQSGDSDPSVNSSKLVCAYYTSAWQYPTVGTKTSTSVQVTGLTAFGAFQLAEGFSKQLIADGNWSDGSIWTPTGAPGGDDDVAISNGKVVTVDVTNAISTSISVQNGGQLIIAPSKNLTVSGQLSNSNGVTGFVIQSNATGSGSFIAGSFSGLATVESYMNNSNNWYLVSPAATGGTVSGFVQNSANSVPMNGAAYGMMSYNEATNTWNNFYTSATSDLLNSGQGYCLRRSASGVVSYQGLINCGTKTFNLTKVGTEGWNCIGNPYTSAIKLNNAADASYNFLATNASSLDPSYACIYIWDDTDKQYKILGNMSYGSRTFSDNIFQMGQGFFVKANTSASTVTFNQAMQVHSSATSLKSAEIVWPSIALNVRGAKTSGSAILAFNNQMTTGLDATYDAGLLRGTNGLSVYTRLLDDNGVDFAIQCLPESGALGFVIPVGVDYNAGGEIRFSATASNLPKGMTLILEDKVNKTYSSLDNAGEFVATVGPNSKGTGRFYLHLSNLTTGFDDLANSLNNPKLKIYAADGRIQILGLVSDQANALLFDTNGRNIGIYKLNEGSVNSIQVDKIVSGVYLVKVVDQRNTTSAKLVLSGK